VKRGIEFMNERIATILVVDDDPYVCESISSLLEEFGYSVVVCSNAREAMDKFQEDRFDAVLTDIKMPEVTGVELLEKIHSLNSEIPVVLMTAYVDLDVAISAIKKGAFDFITKPFTPEYLAHTIEKAVKYTRLTEMENNYKYLLEDTVRGKTKELSDALLMTKSLSKEVIELLTKAAEFRDTDTGVHITRISLYSQKIAEALNLPTEFIETITFASPMHDIGKIGIPDSILLKQGPLTPEEFDTMKMHTAIGEKILSRSSHPYLKMAASIALNHHERWDGTGYLRGLKGEEIPLEGRIVMICDQYDAMRSKRLYKLSLGHQETFKIITQGDGRTIPEHFNPQVLKAFIEVAPLFNEIFDTHQD
jgi:putative two-component system response regulator